MIDEALGHCLSKSAFIVDKQQMLLRNFAHLCGGGILTRPRVPFSRDWGKKKPDSFFLVPRITILPNGFFRQLR